MNKLILDNSIEQDLQKARITYGDINQILVSIEELAELICAVVKFPRYTNKDEARARLHDKVLDEVADVMVILDHVKNIFQLSDESIDDRINAKTERLHRWLENSSSMQETITDRDVRITE